MSSCSSSMESPMCLVENVDGSLRAVPEAVEYLNGITQPVVAVAVVGLYRTGKSYLMNRLAGKTTGFALGATIESKTKGIWMWCVPHPTKPDHTLVLLDTEGLGDVDKGDDKNDTWIFCLTVLLSSALVYNSMGTIDNTALEKLHYVTELTEHIKVKSSPGDEDESTEFMRIFPSFIWTVRDFTLELMLKGHPITADQYLDNALKLKPGHSVKIQEHNLPRECLRNYFSVRKCFVFERPATVEKMKRMEELTDADLEPSFVEQAKEFCNYIFSNAKTKTMKGGLEVTGRMLGDLAEMYVQAIRSGQIPCLDSAVVALAQIQNSKAVAVALEHYRGEMAQRIAYPTETLEELSDIHGAVEKEAIGILINRTFKDEDQIYQLELMEKLQSEYVQMCKRNEEESLRKCRDLILCVFDPLEEGLETGFYTRPGGYRDYSNALEMLTFEYRSMSDKGVKSEEVLKEYLDAKAAVGLTILAADESLSQAEQEMEEAQVRNEAAEQEKRVLEEENRIKQRQLQDQERTYKENTDQLMAKIERDHKSSLEEHGRVLAAKLREQKDLLEQGFSDRASRMQREIDSIRESSQQSGSSCVIS